LYFEGNGKRAGPYTLTEYLENLLLDTDVAKTLECKPMQVVLAKTRFQPSLKDVKSVFHRWLYFGNDDCIIAVTLAAACDRMIPGDPVWLLLVVPSGGTKTELLRSLTKWNVYNLDSITTHTLVSGKVMKTKDGIAPVQGILPKLNDKILIIKDFTIILTKRNDERNEIFGQLRGAS
jgi:hypothetical protein